MELNIHYYDICRKVKKPSFVKHTSTSEWISLNRLTWKIRLSLKKTIRLIDYKDKGSSGHFENALDFEGKAPSAPTQGQWK